MEYLDGCPLCDCPVSRARLRHVRTNDAIHQCPWCGLLYADPQYSESELIELYRRECYGQEDDCRDRESSRVLHRTVLRDILRRYPHLAPRGPGFAPRVLDYGCGAGHFLAECREMGFEAAGIELSAVAARYARRRFGLDVRTDPDRALAELPASHCQLVTAWQVIEHTRRPRAVLQRLAAALVPGGVLCLATPNPACWRYLLEGGRWFNIRNPTHLALFGRRNLTWLLRGLGLVRIIRPVFWGGRPGFGTLASAAQYAARLAGLGSDLRLYAQRPARKDTRG